MTFAAQIFHGLTPTALGAGYAHVRDGERRQGIRGGAQPAQRWVKTPGCANSILTCIDRC